METGLNAATQFLLNFLSMRGEKLKESDLKHLGLWATRRGELTAAISGGRDRKLAPKMAAVGKKFVTTLQAVSAERKPVKAAIQGVEAEKSDSQPCPKLANSLIHCNTRPVKAAMAPTRSGPQDVLDHVTQVAEVSSPLARPTAQKQDGTPWSPSGGVVNDVSSGGARGGTERTRGADHRGGAEGGDGSNAEQPTLSGPLFSHPRGRSQWCGGSKCREGRQHGRESQSQQVQP